MRKTLLAALSALTLLTGCQTGAGSTGGIPASPYQVAADDIRKADALHVKALQSGKVMTPAENPVATQYLDRVAARVGTQRAPGSVPLRAFIVKDDDVNAFTTGTGYLYFNSGLLAALENEAQLAMIVGHEAAHVDAGHLTSGNRTDAGIDLATEIGTTLLSNLGGGLAGTIGALGVGLAGQRASAYYSQGAELEADDIGLAYAMRAGYDGAEAANAFRVMARENGSSNRLAEFFSSHPNSEARRRSMASKAAAAPAQGYVGREEYARMLASLGPRG